MLARSYVLYYVPTLELAPSKSSSDSESIHRKVVDQGREPETQKVQTSKRTSSGVSRIRSVGELAVGLDQNNLLRSTAHPEPTGFESEIAGLLAQEFGVRLKIYWAYSSHESYPSKLSRGLRHVLLGVATDGRYLRRHPLRRQIRGRGRRPLAEQSCFPVRWHVPTEGAFSQGKARGECVNILSERFRITN
jgi:hypothetical protein